MQRSHVTTIYAEFLLAYSFESGELGWLNHPIRKHDPEQHKDFRQDNRIFGNLSKRTRRRGLRFEKLRDRGQKRFHQQSSPKAAANPSVRRT